MGKLGLETLLGVAWCLMFVCFILFIYKYINCYWRGVLKDEKLYYYQFVEIDPIARRIAVAFILFMVMTVMLCVAEYEIFLRCL